MVDTSLDEEPNEQEIPALKDEINIETDYHQKRGACSEVCKICWKPFDREPKIRCAECKDTVICLQCFSLGLETQTHRCDHAYHIDRRHIHPNPDTDWSLTEDFDLLQGLIECGYGNYEDLGKRFMHRTFEEIRRRTHELLELDKAPLRAPFELIPKPLVRYHAETYREEPPRYPSRCHYGRHPAGYCAPRGDFDSEYSNNSEQMLQDVNVSSDCEDDDDDDEGLNDNLSCAIVQCYNEVLKERARRKNVVKNHALLLKRNNLPLALSSYPRLMPFVQLLGGEEFDSLIEGLNAEGVLIKKFMRLRKYRALGITRHHGIPLYDKLQLMRNNASRDLEKYAKPMALNKYPTLQARKSPRPIDVALFSGFEHLTPKERELCNSVRLLPENYLRLKKQLIDVNAAEGGVRLMTARQLLKIDVNKTRKIYNFLRDEDIIKVR